VSDVIRAIDRLDGLTVRVRGHLIISAEGAYLVRLDEAAGEPAAQQWQAADRLPLDEPDLVPRLYATVPVRVGGPFQYRDEAILVGRVVRRSDGGPLLTELQALTVVRQGARYVIDFDR
jgi:hypothetical protein